MQERLQKLISMAGIASRRDAEALIEQGRVVVNGQRAHIGDKADPATDDIRVDGERLRIADERVYIIVNKPMQVVTAVSAQRQEKRPTVRDIVPVPGYLYPVGRLDADSEGIVLLTNDGELAEQLSHPRFGHAKVYRVTVQGRISDEALDIWRRGIMLDDGPTRPAEVKLIEREAKYSVLQVTMREGRKRQIRRIAAKLGHPVQHLVRTHLATLALGELKPGEWRYLDEAEIRALKASAASGRQRASGGKPPRASRPACRKGMPLESREARYARKAAQPGSRRAWRETVEEHTDREERPRRPTARPGAPKGTRSGSRPARRPGGAGRKGKALSDKPLPPRKRPARNPRRIGKKTR